uniref:Uncharacterized protein n=1 Tax=Erpetoichthys calabaricus TaxID=27687 RepID=A0A8C4TAW6_ERPCA
RPENHQPRANPARGPARRYTPIPGRAAHPYHVAGVVLPWVLARLPVLRESLLEQPGQLRRHLLVISCEGQQKLCPICDQFVFESDFIEVTEAGKRSISTGGTTVITVGIISSDSSLPLPDAMLVATYTKESNWASLLALEAVKLSVLSTEWQQLKVELPNKLEYRLQLLVPEGLEKLVFNMWVALLNRLSDANPLEQKKVVSPPEDMVNAHENSRSAPPTGTVQDCSRRLCIESETAH